MNFRQKGALFSLRTYTIEQDGLKLTLKSPIRTREKFYDFRKIGKEVIEKQQRPWLILLPLVLSLTAAILLLTNILNVRYSDVFAGISLFIAGTSLIIFFLLDYKYIFLSNNENGLTIPFLDKEDTGLDGFILSLKKAQRIRLQHRFLSFDENMSYDEFCKNVRWLRDNEFLSNEEAELRLGGKAEQLKQA